MGVALALSPHLDDAAFSAGGTLACLVDQGWTVVLATLFTASVPGPSGFALACQTDKGLSPDADYMALRRAEDLVACKALGARPVWLGLREAPHRGYASAAELFAEIREDDTTDQAVSAAIAGLLSSLQPTLLLAPQAIGAHVDHVLTARAIQQLRPAVPVLWWQDFPYTTRNGRMRQPFTPTMDGLPEATLPSDPLRRLTACAAYTSQLGFQFGGLDGLTRALSATGGDERVRVQGDLASAGLLHYPLTLSYRASLLQRRGG